MNTRHRLGLVLALLAFSLVVFAGEALADSGTSSTPGSASSGSVNSAALKPVEIDLSYQANPTDNPWNDMAKRFKSELEAQSAGRITVKLFPGGQLSGGNQQKELELLQGGTIEASIMPSSTLSSIDPRFEVVSLPWILPNYATVKRVIGGNLGQEMLSWFGAKGLHAIAIGSNGFRQLTDSKHPVETPQNLSGLKVRVPGNPVLLATWKALGADPVAIDFSELYTSLQEGTVNGQDLPFQYVLSNKIYEVNPYGTELNYSFDMIFLTFNKSFWDGLSSADQSVIRASARDAMQWEVNYTAKSLANVETQLEKHGMKIAHLSPTQIKAFQDKVAPVYAKFAPKIGSAVVKQFQDLSTN